MGTEIIFNFFVISNTSINRNSMPQKMVRYQRMIPQTFLCSKPSLWFVIVCLKPPENVLKLYNIFIKCIQYCQHHPTQLVEAQYPLHNIINNNNNNNYYNNYYNYLIIIIIIIIQEINALRKGNMSPRKETRALNMFDSQSISRFVSRQKQTNQTDK